MAKDYVYAPNPSDKTVTTDPNTQPQTSITKYSKYVSSVLDTSKALTIKEAKYVYMLGYGGLVLNFFGETGKAPRILLPTPLIKKAILRGATVIEYKAGQTEIKYKLENGKVVLDETTGTILTTQTTVIDKNTGKLTDIAGNFDQDTGGDAPKAGELPISDLEGMIEDLFDTNDKLRMKAIGAKIKEYIDNMNMATDVPKKELSEYEEQLERAKANIKKYIESTKKDDTSTDNGNTQTKPTQPDNGNTDTSKPTGGATTTQPDNKDNNTTTTKPASNTVTPDKGNNNNTPTSNTKAKSFSNKK